MVTRNIITYTINRKIFDASGSRAVCTADVLALASRSVTFVGSITSQALLNHTRPAQPNYTGTEIAPWLCQTNVDLFGLLETI